MERIRYKKTGKTGRCDSRISLRLRNGAVKLGSPETLKILGCAMQNTGVQNQIDSFRKQNQIGPETARQRCPALSREGNSHD